MIWIVVESIDFGVAVRDVFSTPEKAMVRMSDLERERRREVAVYLNEEKNHPNPDQEYLEILTRDMERSVFRVLEREVQ